MATSVDTARREEHTTRAARQAAVLFLLSAALSTIAISSFPDRRGPLLILASVDLAIVVVIAVLPWGRFVHGSTVALALAAWAVVGGSTWVIGGIGSGSGAYIVLAFAWLGLHHGRRTILLNAPLAGIAYALGLALNGGPHQSLLGTLAVVPYSLTIGLIIEGRVRRLKAARVVIEEEQRWRAALMATMAHDVRSPLTTIHGVLEILVEDTSLPPHLRPLVASAVRQTSRLTTLASSLLDLERVEGGKLVLDWQDVDLDELCRQVAELLVTTEVDGADEIGVEVEPGLRVRADPVRLQQMLVNLGTNAQRHGQPPLMIGARSRDTGVEIFVRDHGVGIPDDERPLLFQRLGRTDGNPESVGLGLWIVRLLARAHGGEAVHRSANPGSEFVIHLPDRSTTLRPQPTEVAAPAQAPLMT